METIYCISGLGADESVFQRTKIKGAQLKHISWPPFDPADDMESYSLKVSALIPGDNPIILGLSFGGMLTVEIAKRRKVKKAIIVSSAKSFVEVPHFSKLVQMVITSLAVPAFFFKMPNAALFKLFGASTENEKQMLSAVLKKSDGQFMRWAMKAVTLWHNTTYPPDIVHIHGTDDKIIPPVAVKPTHWIEGGSHIMIYNKAAEVNRIIEKELHGNHL
jgi:pimeloyl-ACP methyl ester carboxylesterase